jgi:hypothetical protein
MAPSPIGWAFLVRCGLSKVTKYQLISKYNFELFINKSIVDIIIFTAKLH